MLIQEAGFCKGLAQNHTTVVASEIQPTHSELAPSVSHARLPCCFSQCGCLVDTHEEQGQRGLINFCIQKAYHNLLKISVLHVE